jgi:hypothetical protein
MNADNDMQDNVVSPITCVSMNHQNQLEQMANGTMFATEVATPAVKERSASCDVAKLKEVRTTALVRSARRGRQRPDWER